MNGIRWEALRAAFVRRVPGDVRHHAEDIAAESVSRLFSAMKAQQDIRNPDAFGFGILWNVVRETRRGDRLVELDSDSLSTPEAEEFAPSVASTPDLENLKRQVFSTSERKIFNQYYHEGGNAKKRREKLARSLEMTMGTLYTKISRLKDRLRAEAA